MNDFMPKGVKGFKKGHSVPKYVREIVSKTCKIRKASDETRRKISVALKGKKYASPPPGFGEKVRQRLLGTKQSPETIAKRLKSRAGYKHSQKTKDAISASHRNNKKVRKTDESRLWRKRIEYRLWREAVFARDNWTCQACSSKSVYLHPHHIKNFAEAKELRFAIDNGITFCTDCHKIFHKTYGNKKNTVEQVIKFLELQC